MDKIFEVIQKEPQILFAYLFGSFATAKQNRLSDIDIAIYCKEKCDRWSILKNLLRVSERKIDLVDLKQVRNNSLLLDVIREGKVIKDHPKRALWEVRTYHKLLDFFESTRRVYGY